MDQKKLEASWKVQCGATLDQLLTQLFGPSSVPHWVRYFTSIVLDTPLNNKLKLGAKAPF